MKRRHLQLVFFVGIVIAVMVPATLLSGGTLGSGASVSTGAVTINSGAVLEPSDDTSATSHEGDKPLPLASSGAEEDELPSLTTGNDDGERPTTRTESTASAPTVTIEPDDSDGSEVDSSAPSENRSVVGWSSASFTQLKATSRSIPVALEIPSLAINAAVRGVGVDASRAMEIPDEPNTAGWYRHGTVPGESGSAVIAGHLDDTRGRSVFFDLWKVSIGAEVRVTLEDGSSTVFRVIDLQVYDATALPVDRLFAREGNPQLALVTCAGEFDRQAGRYTKTVVVYAEVISS